MPTPRHASPFEDIDEIARIGRVLREFGIIDATPNLATEWATPEACLKSCTDSLYLMGYQGRKWRDESWLPQQLRRLSMRSGRVKFLLRDQDEQAKQAFVDLVAKWPQCLEVRETERRALFRLVIMDRNRMLLGHYGHEVIMENGENAQGWHSPHLLVSGAGDWGLLIPFLQMFEEMWDEASPIGVAETAADPEATPPVPPQVRRLE